MSDARVDEETIPTIYKTITKDMLQIKGGLTASKGVDCKIVKYSDLNINGDLGSATLTPAAKPR